MKIIIILFTLQMHSSDMGYFDKVWNVGDYVQFPPYENFNGSINSISNGVATVGYPQRGILQYVDVPLRQLRIFKYDRSIRTIYYGDMLIPLTTEQIEQRYQKMRSWEIEEERINYDAQNEHRTPRVGRFRKFLNFMGRITHLSSLRNRSERARLERGTREQHRKRQECELLAFDNRSLFPIAETDQKRSPLCWAHATAALLSEQLCKASPPDCQKQVSVAEVSAVSSKKGNLLVHPTGEFVADAFSYYLNQGNYFVCLEKYAEDPHSKGIGLINYLRQYYFEKTTCAFPQIQSTHVVGQLQMHAQHQAALHSASPYGGNVLQHINRMELHGVLIRAQDENDFARRAILLLCQYKKKNFRSSQNGLDIANEFYPRGDLQGLHNSIRRAKMSGNSISLELCYNSFVLENGDRTGQYAYEIDRNSCGDHAVVLNAVRWNDQTLTCEGYIRNSHGQGALFPSTWYPLDKISPHTYKSTYLINR